MIVSHKYKFIFIKTRKSAGTSIEIFLSPHCGKEDIVCPTNPHVEPHRARNYRGLYNPFYEAFLNRGRDVKGTIKRFCRQAKFYEHMPAAVLRTRVSPQVWNSYFKFCVERNPWDKTLSFYHHRNYTAGGKLSLEEYFQRKDWGIDYYRYMDDAGNLLVDRVVRYERLSEELGEIFGRLGIPFTGALGVRAKSEYRADRRPYREIFSPEQKEIIEKVFAREISKFGYTY